MSALARACIWNGTCLGRDVAGGRAAAVGLHAVPVERVVPGLSGVVEQTLHPACAPSVQTERGKRSRRTGRMRRAERAQAAEHIDGPRCCPCAPS
eukprot:1809288-Rhodomonas_salina.1